MRRLKRRLRKDVAVRPSWDVLLDDLNATTDRAERVRLIAMLREAKRSENNG